MISELAKTTALSVASYVNECLKDDRIPEMEPIEKLIQIGFDTVHGRFEDRIGNPLFAIETNLRSLRVRILADNTQKSLEIIDAIQRSIEQAKVALAGEVVK